MLRRWMAGHGMIGQGMIVRGMIGRGMIGRGMVGRGIVVRLIVGGALIVLLGSALWAKPGTVTTNDGKAFTGDVTEDDKFVYIKTSDGPVKLNKANAKIVYEETVDDQYAARHLKLDAKDVKGRIELAKWASDKNRSDLAVKVLTEARQIDPMNKEAAKALDLASEQYDLDRKANPPKPPAGTGPTTPDKGNSAAVPPANPAPTPAEAPLERRLLNKDEINIIRQKEMRTDDSKVVISLDNNVVKKYLASGDRDAAKFNRLSTVGKAIEILTNGDPSLAKDVQIKTDPSAIAEFKTKVYPLIVSGCGSTSCHGGMKAGSLVFFPGENTAALYTNFYILQTYSTTIDGVKYNLLDRDVPRHSLVLQFGLPASMGTPPHPKVPNMKVRFKSVDDPAYMDIDNWLSNSLQLPQPDYGIKVSPKLPPPAAVDGGPMPAVPPK